MIVILVFAVFSVVCCLLFIYPYAIYPVLLRRFARIRPVSAGPAEFRISLLFCAYNEAEALPDKIANLRQLKAQWPELEVLAYDDGSNDGTSQLLATAGDIVTVVQGAGRTGKAAGMKRLAAMASGEILAFTDANVILAPDAIGKLLPYYADPEVGGVCGTLRYSSDAGSSTAEIGSLYWRLDEHLRSVESATGAVMGADGSIFSIRKSLYPAFPDTVLDDFTVSMSVIFAGKRLIKAPDVIAFEKSVTRRDEEIRRKIRIGARAYHTHLHLRPQLRRMSALNRFKYMSRKLLRWFGGLFLALGALFALIAIGLASMVALAACITAGALLLSIALRSRSGVFAKFGEILTATFATLIGVVQGMRGRTVVTWSPAKSR
jgi:cellulose synthase/poly-beta-1,6-N-acetylglucosamine synthase-like glycosyltransferase